MDKSYKEVVLIDLAKRVKELRQKKGVSQQNAYNDTSIHFARIEQGKRDISYSTLCKVCDYLDVTLVDFFNHKV